MEIQHVFCEGEIELLNINLNELHDPIGFI
jgi:hypothetical protein